MEALKGLAKSKKAIVYAVAVVAMTGVVFGGLDPALAHEFVDKLAMLTMAYLGGQGVADLGKHVGEAWVAGRALMESAGDEPTSVEDGISVAAGVVEHVNEVTTPHEP